MVSMTCWTASSANVASPVQAYTARSSLGLTDMKNASNPSAAFTGWIRNGIHGLRRPGQPTARPANTVQAVADPGAPRVLRARQLGLRRQTPAEANRERPDGPGCAARSR